MIKHLFSASLWGRSVSPKPFAVRLALCLLFVPSCHVFAEQASLSGNVLILPVVTVADQAYRVELSIVEDSDPLEFLLISGDVLENADLDGASSFSGSSLSVPLIVVGSTSYWLNLTLINSDPIRFVLADVGVNSGSSVVDGVAACVRPAPDISHGPDNPTIVDGLSVSSNRLFGGGPGVDGIPAIEFPVFTADYGREGLSSEQLIVGVKIGDEVRAYPHYLLDWHEIVNDQYIIDGESVAVSLNYCPLTGSAMLWQGNMQSGNPSFGTSGLLYNSNLVLYDRETRSLWSQMLEQGICGDEILTIPDRLQ